MSEARDCATCGHSRTAYAGLLYVGDVVAKPAETVRHFRGRCGLAAALWVPQQGEINALTRGDRVDSVGSRL